MLATRRSAPALAHLPAAPTVWHHIQAARTNTEALLRTAGSGDSVAAWLNIGPVLEGYRSFAWAPTPTLPPNQELPQLTLRAKSLQGLMLMETAFVATNGARVTDCERCGKTFLTGPLTGRRSHAKYCSDRCRVAAMRLRNATAP